jgi:hypothetical protein
LAETSALWPDIERVYPWVHKAAHILNNHDAEDAATVQRRFDGLAGSMLRHRDRAASLSGAAAPFDKVTRSYRPGLFHGYAVSDLPRTNNDLEHEFGSQRYHERRATGRKTASPAVVLRGEARLIAAVATRPHPPSSADLGSVDRARWNELRDRLSQKRHPASYAPASVVIQMPISLNWNKRLASLFCQLRKKGSFCETY